MKTLDITAKEWFDKVNGNSYFSARVVIDYALPTEETLYIPFTYGYGDSYKDTAFATLCLNGYIPDDLMERYLFTREVYQQLGVTVRYHKYEKCLKRDVVAWGTDPNN